MMNFKYHIYSRFISRECRSCYSEQKITSLKKGRDLMAPVLLTGRNSMKHLHSPNRREFC